MKVYLDNAATTPIDPKVIVEMQNVLEKHFGNPSSIHSFGRETRTLIEVSRKKIADYLKVSPSEIFFTSGGTESDNTAIINSVQTLGLKNIITTKIEHHAVLHSVEYLQKQGINLHFLENDAKGNINLNQLNELLSKNDKALVTLMHANNEIGNLNPMVEIGDICKKYDAIFHSDTVQSMAHLPIDLQKTNVHFVVGSAHKFHGPKGIGFLYVNPKVKIPPFIHGGSQERNMRGGTENLYGIVGLAKAFEIAFEGMTEHKKHIESIKSKLINGLKEYNPQIEFNGNSANLNNSLYTVLNASFPPSSINEMLLFHLDINGIAASGGSACTSGSNKGSHVLNTLNIDSQRANVRFSFSKYNTLDEIKFTIDKIKEIFNQ